MEIENKIPKSCKVVVIGGGVAGCSTAYHLAKFGWKDTVLLERDVLTSGTTWHAAGLIGQLGSSSTITKLRNYSLNLYKKLEEETGLSTGLKQNGSLTVATTTDRLEELKRQLDAYKQQQKQEEQAAEAKKPLTRGQVKVGRTILVHVVQERSSSIVTELRRSHCQDLTRIKTISQRVISLGLKT